MAKRFYWLKLKEDFFDEDTISWIEDQPHGKEYVLFYLKLCLRSLKDEGVLVQKVGNMFLPYETEKLARITNTDQKTVEYAMKLFKQIGLIDVLDNGEIYLKQVEHMTGSETDKAELMRKKRARDKQKKEIDSNNVTKSLPKRYTEKEIEKELELEIDIELEKDKENNNNNSLVVLPHDKRRKGSKQKKKQNQEHVPYADIVTYLNEKAGKNFKSTTNMTREKIQARWREGFRLEDFHKVIDYCVNEWKGKDFGGGKYGDEYLRPSTLFNQKFEDRLDKAENNKPRPRMKYFSGDVNELFGDV